MSTWNEKCLPWFEEQIENNDEFDYFELCDSLLDFEMETVDMYYKKLLRMAKKYKHLTNIVKKAEGNMSVSPITI
jgi:hypothetical protein